MLQLCQIGLRSDHHWLLWQISFEFKQPEIVWLAGHNGAGKTTLLQIIATLQKPSCGRLFWFGEDATAERSLPSIRRRLAFLGHEHGFYEALSAYDNLKLWARLLGQGLDPLPAVLEEVALAKVAHKEVYTFSAGMKRRLMLARLILQDPQWLLLDEPFNQLDDSANHWLEGLLQRFHRQGSGIIFSSHDTAKAEALASKRLSLKAGRLLPIEVH